MGDQNPARGPFEASEAHGRVKSAELADLEPGREGGLFFQVVLATEVKLKCLYLIQKKDGVTFQSRVNQEFLRQELAS
jgi:hypothetical protein